MNHLLVSRGRVAAPALLGSLLFGRSSRRRRPALYIGTLRRCRATNASTSSSSSSSRYCLRKPTAVTTTTIDLDAAPVSESSIIKSGVGGLVAVATFATAVGWYTALTTNEDDDTKESESSLQHRHAWSSSSSKLQWSTQCEEVPEAVATSAAATTVVSDHKTYVAINPKLQLDNNDSLPLVSSCKNDKIETSQMIFIGSGSSTGCPRPLCAMIYANEQEGRDSDNDIDPALQKLRHQWSPYCPTSALAIRGNPLYNKDYRNNPSLLISLVVQEENDGEKDSENATLDDDTPSTGTHRLVRKNVIIDVGKTFREGALRWFPHYGIRSLDAIILTHEHMDAAAGLDDVRGFQSYKRAVSETQTTTSVTEDPSASACACAKPASTLSLTSLSTVARPIPMPLYLSSHCLSKLQDQFPWLLPKKVPIRAAVSASHSTPTKADPVGTPVVARHVASFDVTVFEAFVPFDVLPGFAVTPLPVMHGEDLVSFGFAFSVPDRIVLSNEAASVNGETKRDGNNNLTNVPDDVDNTNTLNVVYLSDISRMLPETLDYIQTQLPQPTHVLVLDALLANHETNAVHYNLPQALALVDQIQPLQTYLVGMNCDSFLPHDQMNAQLLQPVEHDGNGNSGSRTDSIPHVQLAHDGLVLSVKKENGNI